MAGSRAAAVCGFTLVVEGVRLAEGAVVAAPSREPDEPFVVSHEAEDELLADSTEVERGDFSSDEQVLDSIRKHGRKRRCVSQPRRAPRNTSAAP